MLKIYNSLTRKLEIFKPLRPTHVGIYSCGPTVYWNQHIGHMYAYVQWDVLVRFLKYLNFQVKWVMNITDVGHLTGDNLGDADTGEDKMEKGAKREGLTVWQVAEKYIDQFLQSLQALNIQKPDYLPRATEHIQEQIDLIRKIEEKGFTYQTKTGLVFDTAKFPDYPKFARLNLEKQKPGSRVEVDPEKKNPWDFLLWVVNQPEHAMQWDSPWGRGFPGWHIECTAMSVKYLGERFDIHTGGKEHIPVHHTNEIAQAYGAFGNRTANYWLHNGWLVMNKEKMSKSLGNNILVTDLISHGYDPLALRYLILTSHYRKGVNFTWPSLVSAQTALYKLRAVVAELKTPKEYQRTGLSEEKLAKIDNYRNRFEESLGDDLNAPQALATCWEVVKSNLPTPDKLDLILSFDEILGLRLDQSSVSDLVKKLISKRERFRKAGKFDEADKIRLKIEDLGYMIKDTGKGAIIKPK